VTPMMDVVFVVVTLAFFLVSWLYVRACERV
jgi:biopolymer transport protein ExbD